MSFATLAIASLACLSSMHDIYDSEAQGKIPSSIGDLTELTLLNAARNKLYGPLPPSMKALSRLTTFDVTDNELTGELPDIFRNMSYIALYGNRFSGPIPPLPILPSTTICRLSLDTANRNQFTCLQGDPAQHPGICYETLAPLNLLLCPSDGAGHSTMSTLPTVLGSSIAAAGVLALHSARFL